MCEGGAAPGGAGWGCDCCIGGGTPLVGTAGATAIEGGAPPNWPCCDRAGLGPREPLPAPASERNLLSKQLCKRTKEVSDHRREANRDAKCTHSKE